MSSERETRDESPDSRSVRSERFAERLLDDATAALGVFSVYLGDQLGYYETLAARGPTTAAELAAATETDERYAREWLEHQAALELLDAVAPSSPSVETTADEERRFEIPPAHVAPLTDDESPFFVGSIPQLVAGAVEPIGEVREAFGTGAGVEFERYGADLREGQARINKPTFLSSLGDKWLPSMPDVDERLREPDAAVADVGCGFGWSAIGLARAYPTVRVDGYDLDAESVEAARENVDAAGLADRVRIHHRDASDPEITGEYDLVTAFECVHDLSDPVGVLRTMRRLAGDGGTVLVADERVGESFDDPTDVEPMMYGWSVLHCLPVGRADEPSAATGTVMRPETLRGYAEEAGFSEFEVLPVEDFFFRLYRLTP